MLVRGRIVPSFANGWCETIGLPPRPFSADGAAIGASALRAYLLIAVPQFIVSASC
jgi:hypothetical protein